MNQTALSTYFERSATRQARLGSFDCVKFVIEALYIGWGRDYRDRLGYCSRRTAVNRLRAAGGLFEAFKAELGEAVPMTDLKAGDIAYFSDPAIGLVLDDCIAVKAYKTIVKVPHSAALSGWHS